VAINETIETRPPELDQQVLDLVRAAFSDATRNGQDEVDIVVQTWALGASVKPIDLVAIDRTRDVVGHVLSAAGRVGDDELLAVAPLAAAPRQQGRGVGSALMEELIHRADEAGWPAVVLLGAPGYYARFGFEPASRYGIVYPAVGHASPHFQLRRLASYQSSPRGEFVYCWEAESVE
jgi:predicted N-acetyltransferase YhbS